MAQEELQEWTFKRDFKTTQETSSLPGAEGQEDERTGGGPLTRHSLCFAQG